MEKENIKALIAANQNFVNGINVIGRDISISPEFCYVFTGIRRSGKSFLLFFHIQELLKQGHSLDEILYINFEDDRLDGIQLKDLDLVMQCHAEMFSRRPYVFLDEIQNVQGWEKFARRLADNKYKVCITGSNAKMLSGEIASALGGRYLPRNIYPLSFREYLDFEGIKHEGASLLRNKNKIVRCFEEYFRYGGLPEVRYAKGVEKRLWLENLHNKIYLGDIISRYKIRNARAVRLLIKKLAESVKTPASYSRLSNVLSSCGVKIKQSTVAEYVSYAEESCLVFHADNLASKLAERENIKKYYFMDNGILNLFLNDPETALLENLVAVELLRRGRNFGFYRNSSFEIDFIIPEEKTAIQACHTISNQDTLERECSAFVKAKKHLGLENFVIITKDTEKEIEFGGIKIKAIPAWKWLVSQIND